MTSNELKQLQKVEALNRMKMLNIMGQVRNSFRQGGRVYYSERQNSFFNATLYWLDNENKFVQIVNDFESKTGSMVYHAQLTHMEFGDMLSLMYVSKDMDEWQRDRDDIAHGEMFVNVVNVDCDESEYGYIGIKPSMGGVTRTY